MHHNFLTVLKLYKCVYFYFSETSERSCSPGLSQVSGRTDRSMDLPGNLTGGADTPTLIRFEIFLIEGALLLVRPLVRVAVANSVMSLFHNNISQQRTFLRVGLSHT